MFHRILNLLIVFILLLFILAEDYYQKLGVDRDADSRTIRKAFKKIALKKHPDKNPGDEKAHSEFIELNHIYEVLMNEESRNNYDMYGEEGIQNMNSEGGYAYQPWQFYKDAFGIYDDDPEIITLARNDFEQVTSNSDEIWFINFYSTFCSHCHHLAPTWREFAKKIHDGIKIGAVNCADDIILCQSNGIYGYPSLVLYPKKSFFYGNRNVEELTQFVFDHTDSKVHQINEANFPEYRNLSVNSIFGLIICFDDDGCLININQYKLAHLLRNIVVVATIDCSKSNSKKVCTELNRSEGLVFYPAEHFESNHGMIIEKRDLHEIQELILNLTPDIQFLTEDEANAILSADERQRPILIGFIVDNLESEIKKLPFQIGNNVKLFLADCTIMLSICMELGFDSYPRWVLFKNSGYEVFYDKVHAISDVANFVRESLNSPMITLTESKYYEAINNGTTWLIDHFTPWCPPCLRLLRELKKLTHNIARELNLQVGTVDCVKHHVLCKKSGINSYPTTILRLLNTSYTTVGYHDIEDILNFIEDMQSPSVHDLNPEDFQKLVENRELNFAWVVDFFAPWCQPCQQLAPEFRNLARDILRERSDVSFGTVDCQKYPDFCYAEDIQYYPTIHLYQQFKNKDALVYPSYPADMQLIEMWLLNALDSKVRRNMGPDFIAEVLDSSEPWLILYKGKQYAIYNNMQHAVVFDHIASILDEKVKLGEISCGRYEKFCEALEVNDSYFALYLYKGNSANVTQRISEGVHINEEFDVQSIVARTETALRMRTGRDGIEVYEKIEL